MSTSPIITINGTISPFPTLSTISYVQSSAGGGNLPVLQGEQSNYLLFRVYNNLALSSGIATAMNVQFTVYDGVNQHTCALYPVSQSWVRIMEYGYGENSTASPDRFTFFLGTDTAIGGNNPCGCDYYTLEMGSDGSTNAVIRAASTGAGAGYVEMQSYVTVPQSGPLTPAPTTIYSLALSLQYEW